MVNSSPTIPPLDVQKFQNFLVLKNLIFERFDTLHFFDDDDSTRPIGIIILNHGALIKITNGT